MKSYCTISLHKRSLAAFIFIITSAFNIVGQTSATSSPYSRFALGRPENTGFASVMAMGGSYTAMRNDTTGASTFYINQGNPASYAFNKFTTYEFGARYAFSDFISKDANVKKQNGGFNYVSLSFPIRKTMGAAIGLAPFSNVGYEVTNTENVDSIGTITNNYRGTGGINQVFAGFGWRPFAKRYRKTLRSKNYKELDSLSATLQNYEAWKDVQRKMRRKRFFSNTASTFSMGSNVSFLYGTVNYATRKYFPASFGAVFNTCDYTETQLHDVYVQAGAMITFDINSVRRKEKAGEKEQPDSSRMKLPIYRDLKKKWHITLAGSVSLPKAVSANATHIAYSFTQASFGREIPFDTFSYQPNYKGRVNLPLMASVGIGIKRGESFTILLDAGYQQWSKFSFLGDNQDLKDQIRFSGGVQWQPAKRAVGPGAYFKRTFYRLGGRYNTGYLFLKGNHISEYAVSGGLGLPVGRNSIFTVVNLSAEYGIGGTTNNLLIQEKFLRFSIGLTFNDRWFIKTKYD